MRITSGTYGGRNIAVPKTGDVRPTQDRVRQALFSMLMAEVPGCRFLDLFAGSGAVGLEALSRGARAVAFVEQNPRHLAILQKNVEALTGMRDGGGAVRCIRADAYRWLASYAGEPFDLVFADPPYALGEEKGYADFLKTLALRGVVRRGGIFAAEMTSAQVPDEVEGWRLFRERDYGKTRLGLWANVECRMGNGELRD